MIRHSISLKFESFNPDSSVPIIRTRDDIIAALTASNMGPVKIIQTSVVTTYARFESELVS